MGIFNDIVAAGVFFLIFQMVWIVVKKTVFRNTVFFVLVIPWVLLNYINFEYIATFNRLLPVAWFHEFWVNKNAMGGYGSFIQSIFDFVLITRVVVPLMITIGIVYFVPGFLQTRKKWYLPVIVLISVAAQVATLEPDIQPIYHAPLQNTILKYWYYDSQETRMPKIRTTPLQTGSKLFREVVFEEPLSDKRLLPQLSGDKPNVVLIMLESFRSFEIGAFGSQLGITPNFDEYAEQGVLFTNIYSTGHLTKNGQWSIFCSGFKNSAGPVLTTFPDSGAKCLTDYLTEKGYDNWWFHGQSAAYDRQGYFMNKHHVTHIMDRLSFPSGSEVMGWGISDKALFEHSMKHLEEMKEPFFLDIQTQTNHHPYRAPDKFKKDRGFDESVNAFLNTFHYTDAVLGQFLDAFLKTEKGKNSLIIMVADHGNAKPLVEKERIKKYDLLQRFHIPLLILYPENSPVRPRKRLNVLGSQADLMPTLFDILGMSPDHPLLGKSLIREYNNRYVRGLVEGSWLLLNDRMYIQRPVKKKIDFSGKEYPITEKDQARFGLMQELDDIHDWIVQQKDQSVIINTLQDKLGTSDR